MLSGSRAIAAAFSRVSAQNMWNASITRPWPGCPAAFQASR